LQPYPKSTLIVYWVTTVLLALLFAVPGTALLIHAPHFAQEIARLGYPAYFMNILGVWKILGAMVILVPRMPVLKEWAYAGMIFDISSAIFSHMALLDGCLKIVIPIALLFLVALSWSLRPQSRKLNSTTQVH
jgi:DoxX-like family